MKVKELRKWLKDFNQDLEVVIADYDKIGDEDEPIFMSIDGVEQLTSDTKEEFISIHS